MFALVLKVVSTFPAFLSIILLTIYLFKTDGKKKVPKALWYYWVFSFFPFVYILAITSIVLAITDICYNTVFGTIFTVIFFILGVCCQQIRMVLIITILERLIATIFLEKYEKYSKHIWISILLSIFSYAIALIYIVITMFGGLSYNFSTIMFLLMHGIAVLSCRLLQVKNTKMYKLLAFQVSLKRRYQIVENVKTLAFFWFALIITSTLGPMGIILRWLYYLITLEQIPYEIIYMSYNMAFVIMLIHDLRGLSKRQVEIKPENTETINVQTVISPLGVNLPAYINVDNYFNNLKNQWK